MQIEINRQTNISLSQIIEKSEEGFSVLRSAHVGNARLYNQVLANAGVRMLLVDTNITGVDTNYMPESIIQDQLSTRLAADGQLTMRTAISDPDTGVCEFLDILHSRTLKQTFPNTEVTLNTDYLRANQSVAAAVIQAAIENEPEISSAKHINPKDRDNPGFRARLFTREIRANETATNKLGYDAEVKLQDIITLKDNPRIEHGVIIPNELDIVINFIVELLSSGRDVQYHISGPSMTQYINGIKPVINAVCGALEGTQLGKQLPEKLSVELIPGTALGIAAPINQSESVATLGQAIENKYAFDANQKAIKRQFFSSKESKDNVKKQAFLAKGKMADQELLAVLASAAQQCPNIQDPGENCIPSATQYDTLDAGGLYVPEIIYQMNIQDLIKIFKTISIQNEIGESP